jgi:hypothetical protein
MNNLIIIDRSDLTRIVDHAIEMMTTTNPWMSQNQASKLIGRKRLQKAMEMGLVAWEKPDLDNLYGRVYVSRKDIQKLLNKPTK